MATKNAAAIERNMKIRQVMAFPLMIICVILGLVLIPIYYIALLAWCFEDWRLPTKGELLMKGIFG